MEAEITGVEELVEKFRLMIEISQSIVVNAAKEGAEEGIKLAIQNLQPSKGDFKGRDGKHDWGQYTGGTLKRTMAIKPEKSIRGKKVYRISTTWYAHFKDNGFTTRDGKRIDGSHFLRYVMTQHYNEIKQKMYDRLTEGVNKVVG